MSDLFRERVTKFLRRFVNIPESCTNCDGIMFNTPIKQSLKLIVQENILTTKEITEGLLACDVILPVHQINEWVAEA